MKKSNKTMIASWAERKINMQMIRTVYDLMLLGHSDVPGGNYYYYENRFYSLEVQLGYQNAVIEVNVNKIADDLVLLPDIELFYDEKNGWQYNITYQQLQMSLDDYKGKGQDYVSQCTAGQVSAQVLVEKVNKFEELAMLEIQREYIRESFIEQAQDPMSDGDWRTIVWNNRRLSF